jgi:hypothetical protein
MRNKLLKFADFKGGTDAQDPKKQIKSAGGSPKKEKEKAFDQVKRSKLAQLDKTEPDYSKTKKVNEDAAADAAAIDAASVEVQKAEANLSAAKAKLISAQTKAGVNQQKTVAAAGTPPAQPGMLVPQKTA